VLSCSGAGSVGYTLGANKEPKAPTKASTYGIRLLFLRTPHVVPLQLSTNIAIGRPPLWSSGQSSWLLTQGSPLTILALPDFLSSSESGTGSTQSL
jgi:hypothetical protein